VTVRDWLGVDLLLLGWCQEVCNEGFGKVLARESYRYPGYLH